MVKSALLASLERDGFVVIPSILTPERLAALRTAAAEATELARSGRWPHIRTVGKQFPPWPSSPGDAGIWGVQALLHPEMPGRDEFARLYFSDEVLGAAKELMGGGGGDGGGTTGEKEEEGCRCSGDDLVMELLNMLVRPGSAFELRWHRDDIPASASDEEELARLREPAWHAQWNLALYDDDSLVVVPGSHARARTAAERAAGPFETGLEAETRVRLAPGDVAFYDNNILHRGVYDPARERMTLHGSVGHVRGGRLRARNVLQHGVGAWVDGCGFGSALEGQALERAEGMRMRLVRLGRESGDVGFSLSG